MNPFAYRRFRGSLVLGVLSLLVACGSSHLASVDAPSTGPEAGRKDAGPDLAVLEVAASGPETGPPDVAPVPPGPDGPIPSNTKDAEDASHGPDGVNITKDASMDSVNLAADANQAGDAPPDGIRTDTVTHPTGDASACTPEQELLRSSTLGQYTILPYEDVPDVAQTFLTGFLSVDYITEHFRFFMPDGSAPRAGTPLFFYFIDDCYTSQYGEIQWGVPIYQGKILYLGPSREWHVLIEEANAKALVEAAGCDSSDLASYWESLGAPLAGASEFSGASYCPAWRAGGQSVTPPAGLPAGSYCQAATCNVNAETGAVSTAPQSCESPG